MKFSEKLQKLRKEHKLSQEQLADQLDVSRQAVSKWESGQTYPEMDKLLSLCKIFQCSLDDLTNDDIKEISKHEKNQSTISNGIQEVLDVLSRSVVLFESLSFKKKMKTILELIILILILCCFQIPVDYVHYLGEEIFLSFGKTIGNILCPIWNFVLYISYLIFIFICFYYLYKKLFLERLENRKEEEHEDIPLEDISLEEKKEPVVIEHSIEKEKISNTKIKKEVRQSELKEEISISSIVLKKLISLVALFVKFFLLCFIIPFLFFFVLLIVFSIIDIYLILFEHVYFFGILPIIISGIIISYLIIRILFNIIVDRKNQVASIFRIFMISLIMLGIGAGVSVLEFSMVDFESEVPFDIQDRYTIKTVEEEFSMNDNLHFSIHGNHGKVTYVEDENKKDIVLFQIEHYEEFQNVFFVLHENQDLRVIQNNYFNTSNSSMRELVLDSLRNKKFYDYSVFQTMNITIITSSENIEKIKASNERVLQEERENLENSYEKEIFEYQELINQKEEEIDNLNIKISDQEYEIENYKEQIKQYKKDLENYKEEIKNQIQGIINE